MTQRFVLDLSKESYEALQFLAQGDWRVPEPTQEALDGLKKEVRSSFAYFEPEYFMGVDFASEPDFTKITKK